MNPGGTVTLILTQGESQNPTATFSSAMATRQVLVGSGPDAHWKVRALGVEPIHVELYWDGAALWVRDAGSLSGVYVGVERADDWQQVFDGSDVFFGQASFRTKALGTIPNNAPATAPTTRAAFIDEEESTQVFSNNEMAAALRSFEPSVTAPAMQHPAQNSVPGASQVVSQSAPRQATMAPVWNTNPAGVPHLPSLPGPSQPPHTVPPVSSPSPSPAVSTGLAGPPGLPSKLMSSEATVIRPSPYLELEAAGMLLAKQTGVAPEPTLNAGNKPPRLATMAPPITANLPIAPGLAPALGATPGLVPPPLSAPPMGPPSLAIPGPSQSPPTLSDTDDPFGPMDLPPPGAKSAKSSIPPRTWALALATAVVGLGVTFIGPAPPPQQHGPARPRYRVTTVGARPPASNNSLQLAIGDPGLVGVIVPAPMSSNDPQGRPRVIPANPQDPIRLAAEAVANNQFSAAAAQYEALARAHPEAPLFRQFALILRARAVANCQPGAPGCTPAPSPSLH